MDSPPTTPRRQGSRVSAPLESIELSARTVDDAVTQALTRLGRTRDEVDIEVLHAGSPGRLLGFGATPARVRVTLLAGATSATSATASGTAGKSALQPPEGALAPGSLPFPESSLLPSSEPELADQEEIDETDGADEAAELGTDEDQAETARSILVELLNQMGLGEMQVEVRSLNPITMNIHGGDVADLIGRRGENLRALQFVLNLMVSKRLRRHVRIVVDVDGYRARREDLLRDMAQRFAHRVRSTREPMQLEAMPPNERRILHVTLADDPNVTTESIGEGDARRVVIKPRH